MVDAITVEGRVVDTCVLQSPDGRLFAPGVADFETQEEAVDYLQTMHGHFCRHVQAAVEAGEALKGESLTN